MHLSQFSKEDWRFLTVVAALLAGVSAGFLSWILSGGHWGATTAGGILGGFSIGILLALLGSFNLKVNDIRKEMHREHASLREMTNIRPLIDGPPLDYGGWAMDPHLGKTLAQVISRHNPKCILECGSGTSTVFMAQRVMLEEGGGQVYALEHLERFARETRLKVSDHGLDRYAEVVTAPLRIWDVDGDERPWYGIDPDRLKQIPSIDLLVVDGPPKETSDKARYPALPILSDRISEECVVILDDGDRDEEMKIAKEWARNFDMEATYISGGKGGWILQ